MRPGKVGPAGWDAGGSVGLWGGVCGRGRVSPARLVGLAAVGAWAALVVASVGGVRLQGLLVLLVTRSTWRNYIE